MGAGVDRPDWSGDVPVETPGTDLVPTGDDDGVVFRPDCTGEFADLAENILSSDVHSAIDDYFGRSEIGSDEHLAERARGSMRTIFTNLGDGAVAFAERINALPDSVFNAVNAELALSPDSRGRGLTDDDVIALSEGDVGQQLAAAWGRRAGERFSILDARLHRIEQQLNDSDRETFVAWVQDMTPREMIATARALVGA